MIYNKKKGEYLFVGMKWLKELCCFTSKTPECEIENDILCASSCCGGKTTIDTSRDGYEYDEYDGVIKSKDKCMECGNCKRLFKNCKIFKK